MIDIRQTVRTFLRSYGVVAFAPHPVPAILILIASFFHPVVGVMGLVGNIISNLTARWIHANKEVWRAGVYGVSGLLVGLALGMYSAPSIRMWVLLVIGASLSGVFAVMIGNFISRYDLPILSLPFMFVIWFILLVVGVAKGDSSLLPAITILNKADLWLFNFLPLGLFEYVKMFGNIFFQENLLSGLLVMIAIGLYSRISLIYGLWGGILGMITYLFLHGSLDGFHGLNYVLVSLAFGGFFIVTNRHGFVFTSLAIVSAGLMDLGVTTVLKGISVNIDNELPSLVFAFNAVTISFLFPLKMLPHAFHSFRLIPVPLSVIKNPETNLKWYRRWSGQKMQQRTILTLPFNGKWCVLQGNNGEWTHKGVGRFAWDFIVRDDRGHQAGGFGLNVTDYYAYGLPVLAPAPGVVYSLENSIDDNPPQKANTERNWGNYIILDHGNGEYSELSHFRKGSIQVVAGQSVKRGEILGNCGNSGRSPVPHIHYQLQSSPALNSPTIKTTFSEGVRNGKILTHFVPIEEDKIAPVSIDGDEEWSLLGREGEEWVFQVRKGPFKFHETLRFGTNESGLPGILSMNSTFWHIVDLPSFLEIRPDFKTYPSLLSRSGWMDIVGERLILPKKFKNGSTWNKGYCYLEDKIWKIETDGKLFYIDTEKNVITKVTFINQEKFSFILLNTYKLKR